MNKTVKTSELLRAAKALIDTPEKWTIEALARDKTGLQVAICHSDAVCFCSYGAIHKIGDIKNINYWNNPMYDYVDKASELIGGQSSAATFNDSHTHEEVMKMWDKAIELAEQQEAAVR